MEAQSTVYKAVVLKRFWSHNQSRRAKEWAFKRKLIVCVCVCISVQKKKRMEKANFVCV